MGALEDLYHFEGRSVAITGGAGGIGSAVAAAFAERGARVFCIDRADAAIRNVDPIRADVTHQDEVRAAIAHILGATNRLDAVVGCAAVARDAALWNMTDEQWQTVLDVNLTSNFHLLRAAAPPMRERGGGSFVFVSSINGERGKFGQANYAASKAGLNALAKTAARELGAYQIRVNAVAPGFIDTSMTRGLDAKFRDAAIAESALRRAGSPEDVANVILFLCSAAARHVTGQVIRVDGGQYM